ncbi:unnamed protein product [Vitrella brassicaformis CCMP3155]|uniref:Uncharacterized protein n=1 Tax=Vitrella brassicaformis (strain CCMP3155) TaxID=1169540 RepID=A0A0G4EMP6_VITBC|nr:unnamed protein product [Vitrella brassicaformis CCMP3155]|eukprot:CEL98084.1 unnamed protein product [Vitrella brassicaformis CCMP3155]
MEADLPGETYLFVSDRRSHPARPTEGDKQPSNGTLAVVKAFLEHRGGAAEGSGESSECDVTSRCGRPTYGPSGSFRGPPHSIAKRSVGRVFSAVGGTTPPSP